MLTAAKICASLDIFSKLASESGPKSATELAEASGAEPKLLERFLRHLVNRNIVEEAGPGLFEANAVTKLYASAHGAAIVMHMYESNSRLLAHADEALRKTGYRMPLEESESLFRLATGIDTDYFTWLNRPGNESRLDRFQKTMEFTAYGAKWFQTIPLDEILGGKHDVSTDAPLIVDVGGGFGQEMVAFHQAQSDRSGRLIFQDLEATIHRVDAAGISPVEAQVHDFFTPQPVQGAKAYFLKRILHDWDKEKCISILRNLKGAMKPLYSKILVLDLVVADMSADWYSTGSDIMMMLALSATERREKEWREMIAEAGLQVSKIWDTEDADGKLIEIVLA
ncbi:unnamed protein product [Clonostachys solani]|uniref:O-methyltransferase domain-containing protein n=1 Tax=Clonostachys solani TaxID=160281 RepID=A0A9N9Z0I9_9HYPO|nr:unnamed protein product [Clonostachys solani]